MDASLDTCFVAEAEGHDLWNVGTEGSLESGFLCVFWIDQNVIVPSTDVKLGKKMFAFELIELYLDIGHGVVIFDGDIVQLAIIHDQSIFSFILLRYVERWRGIRGTSIHDETLFKFFGQVFAQRFQLSLVERVDFTIEFCWGAWDEFDFHVFRT